MSLEAAPQRDLVGRLRWHVERLAGLIGPRHLGNPTAFHAAATMVERELMAMGYAVERQPYMAGDHEVVNLVAEIPGRGANPEIVVLGAHYDTVPTTPGADDNASAVAVLLETARLMFGAQPRHIVRFVAFACEEPPHCYTDEMGSKVYARRCRQRNETLRGMLCLEMVGFYSTAPRSQKAPPKIPRWLHWLFPSRGNFLAAVGNPRSWRLLWAFRRGFKRAVRFPLFTIVLPEVINDIRRSDNSSFWDQGYCALMLTDTSYLRNSHYHQPTDTPDTLDYARMALVTRGVVGGVCRLAKCSTPPVD